MAGTRQTPRARSQTGWGTTASQISVKPEDLQRPPRPRPLTSLMASAQRLTSTDAKQRINAHQVESWQDDSWDMYDLVGEQRFLATTLASRMAQAHFYVGTLPEDPTADPEPVENDSIASVLGELGNGPLGWQQIVNRMGINLFVAGDGWLAGIPSYMLPGSTLPAPDPGESVPIEDLEWRMLSVSEVRPQGGDRVTLVLGEGIEEQVTATYDQVWLIRVWRPHPRKSWEADSPTRSSLPVLRELVGLTMHISAQVDSRLAGAGLLIIPQSAQRALNVAAGLDPDAEDDPFTEALMEAMMVPINDRASASAVVPLCVTVPDEVTKLFEYITFAKPLDVEARNLRDEAIRRLALGQDAPPELLLGTAGMNHWGAWLVREDVVTTHLEPPLALICDAVTTQYLWPVLRVQGMDEEQVRRHVVWYDVSHLVSRPNRAADANALFEKGVIGAGAVREANGFDNEDAPAANAADAIILDMVRKDPGLLVEPGVDVLRTQVGALLDGSPVLPPVAEIEPDTTDTTDSEPTDSDSEPSDSEPLLPSGPSEPAPVG